MNLVLLSLFFFFLYVLLKLVYTYFAFLCFLDLLVSALIFSEEKRDCDLVSRYYSN